MTNQIYWITTPDEESYVTKQKAHLAYRISNGNLLRGPLPINTHSGMMAIDQFSDVSEHSISLLAAECALFGYRGIFAAVSETPNQKLAEIFEKIGSHLSSYNLPIIVPISYLPYCKNTAFYASTSISGGSLREYLESILQTLNISKLYLEHPLTKKKFTMPNLNENGIGITAVEAEKILTKQEVQAFYSPELFLNYCTYREAGDPHFLLFDDERTLHTKIELGKELRVAGQFLLYRELKEFYPSL